MNRRAQILVGLGILGVGVIAYMKRRELSDLAQSALDEVNDALFRAVLPSAAEPYADVIKTVAAEKGMDPFLIAALGWRESHWGELLSPPGPTGTGDAGHGHGIMQIDDRTWGAWLAANDWTDPYTNVSKGADIYLQNLSYFEQKGLEATTLIQAALAAYNHGPGNVWANIQAGRAIDAGTAGNDYGSDVLARANTYATSFLTQLQGGGASIV